MNQRQTGRRSFLSSIAVLSAGVAFGRTIFSEEDVTCNTLEQQWKYFCERNNAEIYFGNIDVVDHNPVETCSGHISKRGHSVFFAYENIVAQPIWIYWKGKKQASDVVIILVDRNSRNKSIRINRFELEAACSMKKEKNEKDVLKMLLNGELKTVQAKIFDNNNVQISAVAKNKQYSFCRELNYHI